MHSSSLDKMRGFKEKYLQDRLNENLLVMDLGSFDPVYKKLQGWETNLWEIRDWNELPQESQSYIQSIEKIVETPITSISVGPERDQVVHRKVTE